MPEVHFHLGRIIVEHAVQEHTPPTLPPVECAEPFNFPSSTLTADVSIATLQPEWTRLQMTVAVLRAMTVTGLTLQGTPGTGKYLFMVVRDAFRTEDQFTNPPALTDPRVVGHHLLDASLLTGGDTHFAFPEPMVLTAMHHQFLLLDAHRYGLTDHPLQGTSIRTSEIPGLPDAWGTPTYPPMGLSRALSDPEDIPLALVVYSSYTHFSALGALVSGPGNDNGTDWPHRIWQGHLCVDAYDANPAYTMGVLDPAPSDTQTITFNPESPEWLLEYTFAYTPSTLKGLSLFTRNTLGTPGTAEFLLEEITFNPFTQMQEFRRLMRLGFPSAPDGTPIERTLEAFPARGLRSHNRNRVGFRLSAHHSTPTELLVKPPNRTFTQEQHTADGVATITQHLTDHPSRIHAELDPEAIPTATTPQIVMGPPASWGQVRMEEGTQLVLYRLTVDAWNDAELRAVELRTKRTGTSLGGLTMSSNYQPKPPPSLYEGSVVTVPGSSVTPDGYTRFEIPEDRRWDFPVKAGKSLVLFWSDNQFNWVVHHPGDGAPESYLPTAPTVDPLGSGVTIPAWPAPTGSHAPLDPAFAPFRVLGNPRAVRQVFTPATETEIDQYGLPPGTIPYGSYVLRSEEACLLDVRLEFHPYSTGDVGVFSLGSASLQGAPARVPYAVPAHFQPGAVGESGFRWGFVLRNQPELRFFDAEIPAVNSSPASRTLRISVHAVPGDVDPTLYDVTSNLHLLCVINHTLAAFEARTHLTDRSAFNGGGALTGHTLPSGTHTLIFHVQYAPESPADGVSLYAIEFPNVQQVMEFLGLNLPNTTTYPVHGYPAGATATPVLKLWFDTPPNP